MNVAMLNAEIPPDQPTCGIKPQLPPELTTGSTPAPGGRAYQKRSFCMAVCSTHVFSGVVFPEQLPESGPSEHWL